MTKKIIAFMTAIMIMTSIIPPMQVFAKYQNNITGLTITDTSNKTDYGVNLTWVPPVISDLDKDDTAAINGSDVPDLGKDVFYDIKYKNVSKGTAEKSLQSNLAGTTTSSTLKPAMDRGSLYSFKVYPWHLHYYTTQTPNGTVTTSRPAPIDNATYPQLEALYLTDIQVDATGRIDPKTHQAIVDITWDRPTYNGADVFNGYNIYVLEGNSNSTNFGSPVKYVSTADASLKKVTDQKDATIKRFQYSLTSDLFQSGKVYSIKVEPCVTGTNDELRDRDTSKRFVTPAGTTSNNQLPIAFKIKSDKEYRVDNIKVPTVLTISMDDSQYLRLTWGTIPNYANVDNIKIYRATDELGNNAVLMKTLYDTNITQTVVPIPTTRTYYFIQIYYLNDPIPNGIDTPYPSFDNTIKNITPTRPTIDNITLDSKTKNLSISWLPFVRAPYDADEQAQVAKLNQKDITDLEVYYDLYVTDDMNNFSSISSFDPIIQNKQYQQTTAVTRNGQTINVIMDNVNSYTTLNSDGTYSNVKIQYGKLYYIKLVAKKLSQTSSAVGSYNISDPAYGSFYISIHGDIARPQMISKPPLQIKTQTQNSITIRWVANWYEIYDGGSATTGSWHSDNVGVAADGSLVYDTAANQANVTKVPPFYDADSIEDVKNKFRQAGYQNADNLIIRKNDLSGCNYALSVIPYEDLAQVGYTNYLNNLMKTETNSSAWSTDNWSKVTPTQNGNFLEYTITKTMPAGVALNPNTTYAVLFRAYRTISDTENPISFPNYVIDTTLAMDTGYAVKPTVPVLESRGSTDTTIKMAWKYSSSLDYRLVYDTGINDVTKATGKIDKEVVANAPTGYENGILYKYVTINGLFPETEYKVWLYAIGSEESEPSNPIAIKTAPLATPAPPQALGTASMDDLVLVNTANQTAYKPVDYNYIIAEWLKDTNDIDTTQTVTSTDVLTNPEITDSDLVKFSSLIANTEYYLRGKTIVTATKGSDKATVKKYSYVIQLSKTADFKTCVTITTPDVVKQTDPIYFKQAESPFTTPIKIKTLSRGNQFDETVDKDLYPLPASDFEITYDKNNEALNFRFRQNSIDANGDQDNYADQRFISRLIADKVFTYGIDISDYDQEKIRTRTVQIPYSIVKAFDARKISFKIKSDNMTITLPPTIFNTSEIKSTQGLSDTTLFTITMTTNNQGEVQAYIYGLEKYATPVQDVNVHMTTTKADKDLQYMGTPLAVKFSLNEAYDTQLNQVDSYYADGNSGGWQKIQGASYNSDEDEVRFSTTKFANYGVIVKKIVSASSPTVQNNFVATPKKVTTVTPTPKAPAKFTINDASKFTNAKNVTGKQFNNLVFAILNGKMQVTFNSTISQASLNTMKGKGISVPQTATTITREQAMDALVKLYELKSKKTIKPTATVKTTKIKDINKASKQYQMSLLKAQSLGFLNSTTQANPKGKLTYGDLIKMTSILVKVII